MEIIIENPSKPKKLLFWFRSRYDVRHCYEGNTTRVAAGAAAFFSMLAMAVAVIGMPTGLGTVLDMIIFLVANGALLSIVTFIFTYIFSLLYLPLPRRLLAVWFYNSVQSFIILHITELGVWMSLGLSLLYANIAVIASIGVAALMQMKLKWLFKVSIASAAAIMIVTLAIISDWPTPAPHPIRSGTVAKLSSSIVKGMAADPSLQGEYNVKTFSYGSGLDKHRTIFGNDTDVISSSVDATEYITDWSRLKTLFWRFDEHDLPINGRVWVPEGKGPFPLVLIAHGNHLMEYFSDDGYEYLGQLLASRGMIAVSVDANFMNFSVWSKIPNDDMKMRAWLLLKHLQHIQGMDSGHIANNPLQGAVDWSNIALVGHSRGGQAVAMAADKKKWFADDNSLASLDNVTIQSVVAIAPTDKRVDEKSANLENVNYLTLQGARDADVNVFYGDRQYNRVTFDERSERFKASIYIGDANHSQFNEDWGSNDERLPGGLFLNKEGMLTPKNQRQIAKVYISAFLEATLHQKSEYKALFQDYRSGEEFLPHTTYMGRYEGADFVAIERFERINTNILSTSASNMVKKEKEPLKDRDNNSKGTDGLVLQWDKAPASFEMNLSNGLSNRLGDVSNGSIVFSMANMEWHLLRTYNEEKKLKDTENVVNEQGKLTTLPSLPEVEVVINTNSGKEISIVLNEFMPVQSPIYSSFISMGFLEHHIKENKYNEAAEATMHTYIIPIEKFKGVNTTNKTDAIGTNDLMEIKSIKFRFNSNQGKVMIDDIGYLSKGGTYVEYNN
ncbi:hypothetical protein I6N90_09840 [Paenibacillus sp. GSMTC-2017]|uniref:alpha/beta hydrolase family protein n=1 Tax=Paenibacillus sp. GSMTC-2017 TaxID=2794350 RepID=UPI0018DA2081|nr:hypothetical protein [Paenibacillus sp. GSMTC-2017]MBH5318108.1 hypothetical protein [Paenibacillus sp. GSMTC-2017]